MNAKFTKNVVKLWYMNQIYPDCSRLSKEAAQITENQCFAEIEELERLAKIGKITEWMYRRDYTLQAWGVSIDTIEELLEYEEDAEKNNE